MDKHKFTCGIRIKQLQYLKKNIREDFNGINRLIKNIKEKKSYNDKDFLNIFLNMISEISFISNYFK